jgi:hypothetical protein
MAWQARVNTITKLPNDTQNVYVPVDFYDDTIIDPNGDGSTPLIQFSSTLKFAVGTSPAAMQAVVLQEGKTAKACFLKAQSLVAAAPPGTLIPIP